jgi:FKBP-type peptidyl-prolyl cis-trans isomerase
MDVPNGSKFVFFVVPVFVIAIVGIILFFSKSTQEIDNLNVAGDMDNIDFAELNITTIDEGDGREAESGDEISVHYRGTLKDGTEFDSSYSRNEPFTFVLGIGQVIQGWDEGVVGMKVGEKRVLEIPSSLGYGESGTGPIPGNAGLIFEVELVSIN